MSGLPSQLSGAVSATAIAAQLLATHDYASNQARARALGDESPDAERLPTEEWLNRVAALYDASAVEELHGRLVIIGLALLDAGFGERANEQGLIAAIEAELQEPLGPLLSGEGQWRRQALDPRVRPGYLADAPEGEDLLGIANDVSALSDLVAAVDVTPPLAIGLFGEWGSGKSFFMRKMQSRIEDLAAEAVNARARGERPLHCPEVAQISFNAWQYMDANLWASLGAHLFRELPTKLPSLSFAEGRVPEVLQEPLARAEERASKAASDLAQAERQASGLEHSAAASAAEGLQQALAEDPEVRSILEEQARTLERRAGLPHGTLNTHEVAEMVHEARGFGAAWSLVRRSLSPRRLIWLGSLGIAIGVVVFVLLRNYQPTLAAAVALVTVVLPIARPAWRFVGALAAVEHRRAATEQSIADAAQRAHDRATQAADEVASAQVEIEELRSGRALPRVVLERLRSGETESAYRLKLGVIAGLQRDFEDLAHGLAPADDGPPTRIILYIDDLDRCPATLVVEVLQAIHLLLALPLFVIVVAVDPGWLLHSLQRHHAALAGRGSTTPSNSTAEDYLQKIIQIPFRMAPMSTDQYRRLVAGLVPVRSDEQIAQSSSEVQPQPEQSADAAGPSPARALPIRQRAVLLRVEPDELAFLARLAPLVRTPRAAKRLINTYRLVRASIDPTDLQQVLTSGEYRAIALLLALQIRFPGRIEDPGLVALNAARPEELLEALAGDITLNGQPLLQTLDTLGVRELDPTVFRRWAPRLARYSFHALESRSAGTRRMTEPTRFAIR